MARAALLYARTLFKVLSHPVLRLVLHVGPHKTATTSMQYALVMSRTLLHRRRISLPVGLHQSTVHHSLAWQLLGRPLAGLGIAGSVPDANARIGGWIREASANNCGTVVISAEDLSFCSEAELGGIVSAARAEADVEPVIVWGSRDHDELAWSFYKTLLLHGLSQQFKEVELPILAHFERFERRMVSSGLSSRTQVETVEYEGSDPSDGSYLRRALTAILGANCASEVEREIGLPHENRSISDDTADRLLRYNQVASPWMRLDPQTCQFPLASYEAIPLIQSDIHRHQILSTVR